MKIEVKKGGKVYAAVFDLNKLKQKGSFPVTPTNWPIQLLLMNRPTGHVVNKHTHKKIKKFSQQPQEAIVVFKGELKASIFDEQGNLLARKRVKPGQCILIAQGVHEVKFTKNTLAYAFKDGPHVDDKVQYNR